MVREVNGVLAAAHDLKAPLNLVRQLALSLELAEDIATRERIQSQIVSVSDRAIKQINDLTKIARLEDGLFEMEPVGVRGLCEDVYSELRPLFTFEHRQLKITYRNRLRLAIANRELLRSIVYNFCTNALHYSSPQTSSQLLVSDVQGKIRIGVRDFGPALPTKIWRELQQGFISRPATIAMRPGSSGLGLYVASEFAKHMHTKIGTVRHRDGTSFFVDLPVSAQVSFFG